MGDAPRPGDREAASLDGVADETDGSAASPAGEPEGDDREQSETGSDGATGSGPRGREVVVPDRVYKRVTVFSTLFAVVTVVGGFVVLDEATDRATAEISEIDPVLALIGLGCIVLGSVTYAFSTRFRAEGMGNAKDESDESTNNG